MEYYSYDEIGRLTSAAGQGFRYDGFGNLYEKTGNAENRVAQLSSAKNQLGANFDAAGNELWHDAVQYDHDNRMMQAPKGMNGVEKYDYAADHKRVLRYRSAAPHEPEMTLWLGNMRLAT